MQKTMSWITLDEEGKAQEAKPNQGTHVGIEHHRKILAKLQSTEAKLQEEIRAKKRWKAKAGQEPEPAAPPKTIRPIGDTMYLVQLHWLASTDPDEVAGELLDLAEEVQRAEPSREVKVGRMQNSLKGWSGEILVQLRPKRGRRRREGGQASDARAEGDEAGDEGAAGVDSDA